MVYRGFSYAGLADVYSIAVQSDGKILVGGSFNSFDNIGSNNIIRLNSMYPTTIFAGVLTQYLGDYSSIYNARSLVDKAYVDNSINESMFGWSNAANGSTVVGCGTHISASTFCNNTIYGVMAGASITTGCNNVVIGNNSGHDSLFTINTQSNHIVIGNDNTVCAIAKVAWATSSDERDKMNFGSVPHSLDFVNSLNPISYQFKESRDCEVPSGSIRYGFKAQDILALEGETPVVISNDDPEHLKYNESYLIPIYANAIKELTERIKQLETDINQLKNK